MTGDEPALRRPGRWQGSGTRRAGAAENLTDRRVGREPRDSFHEDLEWRSVFHGEDTRRP